MAMNGQCNPLVLNKLLSDEIVAKRFNRHRWGHLFVRALQHYFETLRHVNRFLSTLCFYVSLLKGEGAFEINPVDFTENPFRAGSRQTGDPSAACGTPESGAHEG